MLILVRHGRTAGNAASILQGRLDLELDDVGVGQARQVAAAIGAVDRVICSSLKRAKATAAMFGCEPQIDDRWIELDYGDYDGMALGLVPAEVWEGWRSDSEYTSPGGESMGSLERRVRAACDDVLAVAVTETVVVVSHVTPIKAAVAWALGGDSSMTSRCHLDHAGVCRIQAGARSPILRSFNEVLYDRSRASE